ncbi:DsbA family protein [Streptomyces sp. ODS28]|uniref:DsbA family protein n=1 Tax=Streptomyces sp. ODS28 TaxID=3136688 RepID=UPI0031ED576E
MNDSPSTPASPAPSPSSTPPVLDYWCELQCPDCHRAQDDIRALRERYGTALEIRLRHFPLDKHKYAYAAAQAAEEAYMQGKGDTFVEAVLERTHELAERGEQVLLEVAGELGLRTAEFETALIDGRHLLMVDADHAEGTALGVKGTPTYLIGGELLDGSRSQDGLRERIEEIADGLLGR